MAALKALSGRSLKAPKALLLDFGGVIVQTERIAGWQARLTARVTELLVASPAGGGSVSAERIARDIEAGCIADSHWKNAMSRPLSPPELTHEGFWADFVAADWPEAARAAVVAQAAELCRQMGHLRSSRAIRPGILQLFDAADRAGVPVGIVSNALSGQVHLDFLEQNGLTSRFAVIVHSDAAKVRKPNPEMILLATRQLALDASEAWYVGDNFDRDVLCGVRAGIGGNILMEAKDTYDLPYDLQVRPDAIVPDPHGLLALFEASIRSVAA